MVDGVSSGIKSLNLQQLQALQKAKSVSKGAEKTGFDKDGSIMQKKEGLSASELWSAQSNKNAGKAENASNAANDGAKLYSDPSKLETLADIEKARAELKKDSKGFAIGDKNSLNDAKTRLSLMQRESELKGMYRSSDPSNLSQAQLQEAKDYRSTKAGSFGISTSNQKSFDAISNLMEKNWALEAQQNGTSAKAETKPTTNNNKVETNNNATNTEKSNSATSADKANNAEQTDNNENNNNGIDSSKNHEAASKSNSVNTGDWSISMFKSSYMDAHTKAAESGDQMDLADNTNANSAELQQDIQATNNEMKAENAKTTQDVKKNQQAIKKEQKNVAKNEKEVQKAMKEMEAATSGMDRTGSGVNSANSLKLASDLQPQPAQPADRADGAKGADPAAGGAAQPAAAANQTAETDAAQQAEQGQAQDQQINQAQAKMDKASKAAKKSTKQMTKLNTKSGKQVTRMTQHAKVKTAELNQQKAQLNTNATTAQQVNTVGQRTESSGNSAVKKGVTEGVMGGVEIVAGKAMQKNPYTSAIGVAMEQKGNMDVVSGATGALQGAITGDAGATTQAKATDANKQTVVSLSDAGVAISTGGSVIKNGASLQKTVKTTGTTIKKTQKQEKTIVKQQTQAKQMAQEAAAKKAQKLK